MARRCCFNIFVLLMLLCIIGTVNGAIKSKVFDVVKYGAKADGKTDNTQAFARAWKNGCAYDGMSRILIPKGTFLLGSISFEGSCNGTMAFLIKGTLKAPSPTRNMFTDTWIAFRYISNLTVEGGGILDGQGHVAWPYNDCQTNSQCKLLPATLRFDFITKSSVLNLQSLNSKSTHINVFACDGMEFSHIQLRAPPNSPNTDGIRIGTSTNIKIAHSIISTGDDCISMVSGSQNVDIYNVSCGPGHGISIGSLGRSHEHEYVMGINVRNCSFISTDNGVRIKTWSPSLYSVASNITFEDIVMQNPRNPIVIDQQYCPSPHCYLQGESSSSVQIKDVTFKNIRGISSTKVAVNIKCSKLLPCKNVKLINIDLGYNGPGGQATCTCSHVIGSSYGKQVPGGCL